MGSDWGLLYSKENKAFSFINYTKILLNLVNFSSALQSPRVDVNTTMPFSTKRKKIYGVGLGVGLGGRIGQGSW